jgi:hypothetical protein
MTQKTPAEVQPATTPTPRIQFGPRAHEALTLYEREIATYLRELPRLLAEGYAWKHALVKGDEVLSVWDTQNDAIQAGCERFGVEPIFVKTIDPRDPERFAWVFAQKDSACPS